MSDSARWIHIHRSEVSVPLRLWNHRLHNTVTFSADQSRRDTAAVKFCNDITFHDTGIGCCAAFLYRYYIDTFRHVVPSGRSGKLLPAGDADVTDFILSYLGSGLTLHQICNDRTCRSNRDSISHTFYGSTTDLVGVDTDNLTIHVQQCTAGVTGVDGCVGLDVSTGRAVLQSDLTIQGTYIPLVTD